MQRVELAQRAGGEIARIGEGRLAGLRLAGVERGEVGKAHIDLAAGLENSRRAGQAARDGLDGADVGGDVLALVAVAPRRRLDELAVLVAEGAGEAVDLGLGGHGEGSVVAKPEETSDPGAKLLDLLVGEDVAERQHRHGVADLGEFLGRRRAHLAGQRVGVGQLREGRLERLVASPQVVVFGVGDAGRVLLIVALVVPGDLGAEARVLGARQGEALGRLRLLRHGPKASAGPRAEEGAARVIGHSREPSPGKPSGGRMGTPNCLLAGGFQPQPATFEAEKVQLFIRLRRFSAVRRPHWNRQLSGRLTGR